MKNIAKKVALLLAVVMLVAMLPMAVLAAEVEAADAAALQAAIDAATEPTVIKLTADITTTDTTFTVGADKDITLDLNGKTLSGSTANCVWFSLIDVNGGKLTVMDSATGGKITFAYTGSTANYFGTATNTVSVHTGTLVLESGIIENTTASISGHLHSAVDVLSGSASAYFYMTGGEVISENYIAIRQFANSTTNENAVEISGDSKVTGIIFVQSPNANKNKAELTVTGGEFEQNSRPWVIYVSADGTDPDASEVKLDIQGGDFNGELTVDAEGETGFDKGFISGGTFDSNSGVNDYVADGLAGAVPEGGDGSELEVMPLDQVEGGVVNNDSDEITLYESLEDAFVAAGEDDIVLVNPEVAEGTEIEIPEGQSAFVGSPNGTELGEGSYTATYPEGSTEAEFVAEEDEPTPTPPTPTPTPGRPNPSTGV